MPRAAPGSNGGGAASSRRPEATLSRPPALPRRCRPSTCQAGGGVHPLEELPGAQLPAVVGVGRQDGLAHGDIAARRRPAPLHGAASEEGSGRTRRGSPGDGEAAAARAGPARPLRCPTGPGRAGPAPTPGAEVGSPPLARAGPGLWGGGKEPAALRGRAGGGVPGRFRRRRRRANAAPPPPRGGEGGWLRGRRPSVPPCCPFSHRPADPAPAQPRPPRGRASAATVAGPPRACAAAAGGFWRAHRH